MLLVLQGRVRCWPGMSNFSYAELLGLDPLAKLSPLLQDLWGRGWGTPPPQLGSGDPNPGMLGDGSALQELTAGGC